MIQNSIERNPHHDFVIVINPNSGPGGHPLPCNDYLREIPKLNKYPNVQTVGYIKIDWCRRPLSGTFSDIETYAGWSLSGWLGTYVEGVFVDETPNHFSEERAEYLHAVRKYIRAIAGFGDRRLVSTSICKYRVLRVADYFSRSWKIRALHQTIDLRGLQTVSLM